MNTWARGDTFYHEFLEFEMQEITIYLLANSLYEKQSTFILKDLSMVKY